MSLSSTDLSVMPWSLMTPNGQSQTKFSVDTTNIKATAAKTTTNLFEKDDLNQTQPNGELSLFGENGFTFADALDIINPLQHLPIIGPIYREITGDTLDPGARLAGSALFGGPMGLAVGIVNTAVESHSGEDIGGNILSLLTGDEGISKKDVLALGVVDNPITPQIQPEVMPKPRIIAEPIIQATPSPILNVNISSLTVASTSPISPAPPPAITQPSRLSALQLQISSQMALQIAEANATQIAAGAKVKPEKAKPELAVNQNIKKMDKPAPANLSPPNNDSPLPSAEEINIAMLEALEKYKRLYPNPS